jgi:glutathione S-transferase
MSDGILYIGSRRYSSWSLRGWLAVRLAGLDVEVKVLPIDGTGASPEVRAVSPSLKVPYLVHRSVALWESSAIGEYCAELAPGLYPSDPSAKGFARSIAHEMHAGFRDLRIAMPMVLGPDFPGAGRTPGALADIARIEAIWAEARARFGQGGAFLFGADFTLADAMYAPIVARFLCYRPEMSDKSRTYCEAVRTHPLIEAWYKDAADEPPEWRIAKYEQAPT